MAGVRPSNSDPQSAALIAALMQIMARKGEFAQKIAAQQQLNEMNRQNRLDEINLQGDINMRNQQGLAKLQGDIRSQQHAQDQQWSGEQKEADRKTREGIAGDRLKAMEDRYANRQAAQKMGLADGVQAYQSYGDAVLAASQNPDLVPGKQVQLPGSKTAVFTLVPKGSKLDPTANPSVSDSDYMIMRNKDGSIAPTQGGQNNSAPSSGPNTPATPPTPPAGASNPADTMKPVGTKTSSINPSDLAQFMSSNSISEMPGAMSAGPVQVASNDSDFVPSAPTADNPRITTVAAKPVHGLITDLSQVPEAYRGLIQKASDDHGVDPIILARQLKQESGFNPNARSPAGALGIAQFIPSTANNYKVNPMDPASAIDGQARLMRDNLKQFGGNYGLALAAYNGGPKAAATLARGGSWAPETINYVKAITGVPTDAWVGMHNGSLESGPGHSDSQATSGQAPTPADMPNTQVNLSAANVQVAPQQQQASLLDDEDDESDNDMLSKLRQMYTQAA